jgi:hypothetical protein
MHNENLPKILFQLFIYICISCLIPVFAVASNGATPTDLAGMWNYNSFVSGPSAPWWERGTLNVKPDGTFQYDIRVMNPDGSNQRVIAVPDMLYHAQALSLEHFVPFEAFTLVLLIFVGLVLAVSLFTFAFERALAYP